MTDGQSVGESDTAPLRYGARHLHNLARYIAPPGLHLEQVLAWAEKTKYLQIALSDLPAQLQAAESASAGPGEAHLETDVRFYDAVPLLRLGMALEFTSHIVYSLTEIAANVANKASKGQAHRLPSSFNALRKAVETGHAPDGVAEALGDLSWYKWVREMRTEWTHYSAPFVTPTSFRVYTERSPEERNLPEPAIFSFEQYVQAVRGAVQATEGLAHYVIVKNVLPQLDRSTERPFIALTSDHVPVIRNGLAVMVTKTVQELLTLCGIE